MILSLAHTLSPSLPLVSFGFPISLNNIHDQINEELTNEVSSRIRIQILIPIIDHIKTSPDF